MAECRKFLRYGDNVAHCFVAVVPNVSGFEVRTAAGPPGKAPATRIHPTSSTFAEALQQVDAIVEEYCGNRGYTIAWEHMDSNRSVMPWLEYKVQVKGNDIVEPEWFAPAARLPGMGPDPGVNQPVQSHESEFASRAMADALKDHSETRRRSQKMTRKRAPWNF